MLTLYGDLEFCKLFCRIRVRESGCWEWTGKTVRGGYGLASFRGRAHLAHRAMWEKLRGPIPTFTPEPGRIRNTYDLDHLCRNRLCCNPTHLEPVTASVNQQRRANGAR